MDIKQSTDEIAFKQRIFFALSEPGRYTIVRMLYHVGHEMGCNELNQHVEITTRTQGRQKFVTLNTGKIESVFPGLLEKL